MNWRFSDILFDHVLPLAFACGALWFIFGYHGERVAGWLRWMNDGFPI